MNPVDTAPKDGTPILAKLDCYPWLIMATWNEPSKSWSAATVEAGMYNGEWEYYLVTDFYPSETLEGWMDIPETNNKK